MEPKVFTLGYAMRAIFSWHALLLLSAAADNNSTVVDLSDGAINNIWASAFNSARSTALKTTLVNLMEIPWTRVQDPIEAAFSSRYLLRRASLYL